MTASDWASRRPCRGVRQEEVLYDGNATSCLIAQRDLSACQCSPGKAMAQLISKEVSGASQHLNLPAPAWLVVDEHGWLVTRAGESRSEHQYH